MTAVAAILQHYAGRLIFMKHFLGVIAFQKEKANIFTLLIVLICSEKSSKRATWQKAATMTPNLLE